jgi:hypothetical protein
MYGLGHILDSWRCRRVTLRLTHQTVRRHFDRCPADRCQPACCSRGGGALRPLNGATAGRSRRGPGCRFAVTAATVTHLRGILDTGTVIMLSRVTDPTSLPAEPLRAAVTLAEMWLP